MNYQDERYNYINKKLVICGLLLASVIVYASAFPESTSQLPILPDFSTASPEPDPGLLDLQATDHWNDDIPNAIQDQRYRHTLEAILNLEKQYNRFQIEIRESQRNLAYQRDFDLKIIREEKRFILKALAGFSVILVTGILMFVWIQSSANRHLFMALSNSMSGYTQHNDNSGEFDMLEDERRWHLISAIKLLEDRLISLETNLKEQLDYNPAPPLPETDQSQDTAHPGRYRAAKEDATTLS